MTTMESTGQRTTSSPPDWELVHFAVGCARCGADLRGQTEPRCPACDLEFDWSDAVPLEHLTCAGCGYHLFGLQSNRCPECGGEFRWEEALARYRRTQKDLFEYRWRNQPVRAHLRTWRRALRPSRFWRSIDIHDPPSVGPLILFAAGILLVTFVVLGAATAVLQLSIWWSIPMRPSIRLTQVATETIQFALPGIAHAAAYGLLSFGALMILRQSMARCQVRAAHVARACAYSVLLLGPIVVALLFALVLLEQTLSPPMWPRTQTMIGKMLKYAVPVLLLCIPAFSVWSLRCAYRHYIRMPHSAGVALSCQVIAVLAVIAFSIIVSVVTRGW